MSNKFQFCVLVLGYANFISHSKIQSISMSIHPNLHLIYMEQTFANTNEAVKKVCVLSLSQATPDTCMNFHTYMV